MRSDPSQLEELFKSAVEALEKSEVSKALGDFQAVLRIDPDHGMANYWLGVILKSVSAERALVCLRKAAAKHPDLPDCQIELALAHRALGNLDEAERCLNAGRASAPHYASAQLDLVSRLWKEGKLAEAIEAGKRGLILFPDDQRLLAQVAELLQRDGKWNEALPVWQTLLGLRPNCPQTHVAFGERCFEAGDYPLSAGAFERAHALNPRLLSALLNLGLARQRTGQFDEALSCFLQARAISPGDPEIHKAAGDAFRDTSQWDLAEESWREAVRLRPGYAKAWQNLALGLERRNQLEEALLCHRKVVELAPGDSLAFRYLGMVYQDLGRFQEAREAYDAALRLAPNDADAHWQLFSLLATEGQFPKAWEEHEWRWKLKGRTTPNRGFAQPHWDGTALQGRIILLHAEQGFGDTIQVARYLPMVRALGGTVLVWAPIELVSLLKNVSGVSEVFSQLTPGMQFDLHLPLMSLPRLFGTTLESVPATVPYLRTSAAPPDGVVGATGRLNVGLVWSGSRSHPNDRRPIPLGLLAPLLGIAGIQFYSLQTGPGRAELGDFAGAGSLIDWGDRLTDFNVTAAALDCMDLVITVDTAIAHLAGALGKNTWLLLSFAPDWRWMRERKDSPWYPTMRLFRQTVPGDWGSVVGQVAEALGELQRVRVGTERRWLGQALVLHQSGRLAEAEQWYGRIIQSNPREPNVLRLLGVLAGQRGQLSQAREYLFQALSLQPDLAVAHHDLAQILSETGEWSEAIASYTEAIRLDPAFADAHYHLGNALLALKRTEEAVECYRRAIELRPDFAEAHYNLANVWQEKQRFEDALEHYDATLRLKPGHADALHNRALTLKEAGRLREAEDTFRELLRSHSSHQIGRINLASILIRGGDLKEAEALCQGVIDQGSPPAEAWLNFGVVQQARGQLSKAIQSFEEALRIRPGHPDAEYNLGIAELLAGRFDAGWRHYEARWQSRDFKPRAFPQPLWTTQNISYHVLLIHAEQGYGDAIQFIRFARELSGLGARVIVECPGALVTLFRSAPGVAEVVARGQTLPAFDYHLPLMSVPERLKMGGNIPARVPYLEARGGSRVDLGWGSEGRLKVGLAWAGNPQHDNDRNRSIPLSMLRSLSWVRGARFYSLQAGGGVDVTAFPGLIDLSAQLVDFSATASAISQMDLVVTVDTAAAHLAGALAKPVWILLPSAPDWRWLLERSDSPWYPTARLFRQVRSGDWEPVIERVLKQLEGAAMSGAFQ